MHIFMEYPIQSFFIATCISFFLYLFSYLHKKIHALVYLFNFITVCSLLPFFMYVITAKSLYFANIGSFIWTIIPNAITLLLLEYNEAWSFYPKKSIYHKISCAIFPPFVCLVFSACGSSSVKFLYFEYITLITFQVLLPFFFVANIVLLVFYLHNKDKNAQNDSKENMKDLETL